ncbi:MAG: ABC transporter ATP-binding protein, partial [Gemmataceae bacterium]
MAGAERKRRSRALSNAPLLVVDHLSKSLGGELRRLKVIGDVGFSVAEGEFLSIVGPSGCGKTTLLMCLAGLYGIDEGSVSFLDKTVTAPPAGMSIVFQDYSRSLLPWKNNLDNVRFGMRRVEDVSGRSKEETSRELLRSVGLAGFENHYPWQVSGGMQQRVAIARALAAQSRLL